MSKQLIESTPDVIETRCSKCSNKFQPHHWRHYPPRTGEVFHTGCFKQYKFPNLLKEKQEEILLDLLQMLSDLPVKELLPKHLLAIDIHNYSQSKGITLPTNFT